MQDENTLDEIAEIFGLDPNELEINFDQLDVEWGKQNSILDKYLKASAYCEKLVRKSQEKIKFLRSELTLKCLNDPEGCLGKGQKATASAVEAYYRTRPEYLAVKEDWIEAQYICDLVNGQKSKAYNRKSILEEATKLSLAGWFSAPLVPRPLKELVQEIENQKMKQVDSSIRDAVDTKKETRRTRRNRTVESNDD